MPRHGDINYRNVFYMLTYSPEELIHTTIAETDFEECKSVLDLLGYMINRSYSIMDSNGKFREYTKVYEDGNKPHGKIDILKSKRNSNGGHSTLAYSYYKLNIDNMLNRLIKSAMWSILYSDRLHGELSRDVKNTLLNNYKTLETVKDIEIKEEDIKESRLIDIPNWCKPVLNTSILILKMMLLSDNAGDTRLFKLDDEHRLCYIFEKFIRRYLKQTSNDLGITLTHHTYNDGRNNLSIPDMVVHDKDNNYLVIDTKWYAKETNNQIANKSVVAQYLKRVQEDKRHTVARITGVVLYAERSRVKKLVKVFTADQATGEDIYQEEINMNGEFEQIKKNIEEIVVEHI